MRWRVAGGAGALAVGLAAATALVGRAQPLEMTIGHLLAFALAAGLFAAIALAAWRGAGREMGWRSMAAGGLMALPTAALYGSDSFNALVAESASLRIGLLGLIPLLLAVGIAVVEATGKATAGRVGGGGWHVAVADLLLLAAAGVGFGNLLLKITFGEAEGPALGLAALAATAGLALLFAKTPTADGQRAYLGPLLVPLTFALASNGDNELRHLLITSGGARALAGLLLGIAVYAGWLLRPGTDSLGTLARAGARLGRHRGWLLAGTLLGIGILQAGSYRAVTMDDLARYWIVADDVLAGQGYPTWSAGMGIAQATAGGTVVDAPLLPLLMALSFGTTGHWYHSAQLPIMLANVALPGVLFLSLRAVVRRDDIALAAALLTVLFPPFQIVVLGAAEPDAVFVLELAAAMGLLARMARETNRKDAVGLGVVLVLVALTRPEGPVYALVIAATALAIGRSRRWAIPGAMAVAGMALFAGTIALTTDALWPARSSGFAPVHIWQNLEFMRTGAYAHYAGVLLLADWRGPLLIALLAGLFALGTGKLAARKSVLVALPLAALAQVTLTMAVAPEGFHREEPSEMFRHLAYGLPFVTAMAALGAREVLAGNWRFGASGPLLTLLAVALIGGELYVLGTPEEWYHGQNSGSLLRGGDIYVQALDMFKNPIALPCDGCTAAAGGAFDGFRERLFAHYGRFDMHGQTVGMSYAVLTGVLSAVALGAALARRRVAV
jgi:hypothetical protein